MPQEAKRIDGDRVRYAGSARSRSSLHLFPLEFRPVLLQRHQHECPWAVRYQYPKNALRAAGYAGYQTRTAITEVLTKNESLARLTCIYNAHFLVSISFVTTTLVHNGKTYFWNDKRCGIDVAAGCITRCSRVASGQRVLAATDVMLATSFSRVRAFAAPVVRC